MLLPLAYIEFPSWIKPEIVPGLPVRWYGVMYLVAFVCTYLLTRSQLRRAPAGSSLANVSDETLTNLFFWTIIGLVIGSRLFATTIYDTSGYYRGRPWLIFWPFDADMNFTGLQGMSFHGGLVGSVVGFVVYARIRRIPVLAAGDLVAAAVPLGYTFGRLGNFINGELYGRIARVPWAVLFPNAARLPTAHPAVREVAAVHDIPIGGAEFVNVPRHPSQLYEAFLEGVVLWAILWFIVRRKSRYPGAVISWYLIGYAIARFIAEFFRTPDPGLDFVVQWGPADNPRWLLTSPLNITTGQLLSLGMAAAGAILLAILYVLYRRRPRVETFTDEDQTE